MIKAQVHPKKRKQLYYKTESDPMWKMEAECLLPWFTGKGVDIGCGMRSIAKDVVRCDFDKSVKPDVLCSGDKTPFKDGEFDYVCSIHSFEHLKDAKTTLTEWLRIVKVGGIIGIVHPDIRYTKKQNPEVDNPGLRENPYNRHYHEHDNESFMVMLTEWGDLPFSVVDYGMACSSWSFYAIIKKTK